MVNENVKILFDQNANELLEEENNEKLNTTDVGALKDKEQCTKTKKNNFLHSEI